MYINVGTNHKILDLQVEEFEKNDIIEVTIDEVMLEVPGANVFFIRPRYYVRKVKLQEEGEQDGILRDSPDKPTGDVRGEEPLADVRSELRNEVGPVLEVLPGSSTNGG